MLEARFQTVSSENISFHFEARAKEKFTTDLTDDELDVLSKYSEGLFSIDRFINTFTPIPNNLDRPAGYSLGLDNFKWVDGRRPYYLISDALNLTTWKDGYNYHQLEWRQIPFDNLENLVYQYLNVITNDNKPIVFFVPPALRTHPESRITRWEMEWCLENTGLIDNMLFVFGLYN